MARIKHLLSTAQAQIVPRFKPLSLKFTSEPATFLVDGAHVEKKNHLNLIDQVAKIIKEPKAESGLNKPLLGNFPGEDSFRHK